MIKSLNLLSRLNLTLNFFTGQNFKELRNKICLLCGPDASNGITEYSIHATQVEKLPPLIGSYLGPRYSYVEGSLIVRDGRGAAMRLCNNILSEKLDIEIEYAFNVHELLTVMEDVIFCKLIQSKVLPVHSSAMRFQGKGFLFPGWGGAGKTGILLQAATTRDTVVSDEWNFVSEGVVYPYSDEILLMYYDLLEFPQLATTAELFRAKLFKLFMNVRPVLVSLLLQRIGILLSYKKVRVSDLSTTLLSSFPLDHTYFVQRADVPDVRVKDCLLERISDLVTANFFREKTSLYQLLNLFSVSNQSGANAVNYIAEKYYSLAVRTFAGRNRKILIPKKGSVNIIELFNDESLF